jgi:hypothetical protein
MVAPRPCTETLAGSLARYKGKDVGSIEEVALNYIRE